MKCYQCSKFKSKNPLTGQIASFAHGFCQPVEERTRSRKMLDESCEFFLLREPGAIKRIEVWMDQNGLTNVIRSQA